MLEKLQNEEADKGGKSKEDVELPEEEVTTYWRHAFIFYSLALPLVCASPIQYHWSNMKKDVNCNLAQLAHPDDANLYQLCMEEYSSNPTYWNGMTNWRHDAYLTSMYAPCVFLFVELCVN